MYRLIKNLGLQGLLILGAFFMFTSFAQASSGHHSHHQTNVISPFDKVSSDKPLHCLLNAHFHKKRVCPHRAKHSEKSSPELRADCGSNPLSSKAISFGSDLPKNIHGDKFSNLFICYSMLIPVEDTFTIFYKSIERPPQLS